MEERSTVEKMALFSRWYEVPIQQLKRLPNGDGGFVALAVAMLLYERYVGVARGATLYEGVSPKDIGDQLAADLRMEADSVVDKATAQLFWKIYRNGILHRGFPKEAPGLPRWFLTEIPGRPIARGTANGVPILAVDPWKFAEFVTSLWRTHPEYVSAVVEGYPLPSVGEFDVSFQPSE